MPRMLVLSPISPLPVDRGSSLRVLNLLEAASRDFAVTFVGPEASTPEARARMASLCEAVVIVGPPPVEVPLPWGERWRRMRAARSYMSSETMARIEPFRQAVAALDPSSFALVHASYLMLALAVPEHPERTVVDMEDVQHLKVLQEVRSRRPSLGSAREAARVLRLAWIELVGTRRYLACTVSSDDEARYLRGRRLRNAVVVPNAVPLPAPRASAARRPGDASLVFVGNMAYPPNVDAVRFFVQEVLPLVRRELPEVTLAVVGGGAGALEAELGGEAEFRGFVDDLEAELDRYEIYVAPVRQGGGTKLKVLSALANGIPLVTTPVGASGVGIENGREAVVASRPDELAAGIVALHRDPTGAASMATAGYELVRRRFAWDAVRDTTAQLLTDLAGRAARR